MKDTSLANKVVWITGASSGIGEALAYELAAKGAILVLSARRDEALRKVQAACERADQHLVLPLDMLNPDSFALAVQTVHQRFGRIDVMIHCAGISQRALAIDTQIAVDRRIMDLNYFGPVALTKLVLPAMVERQSGHVVVISSLLGKFGAPTRTAYCASKHALHGFFDALRAEVFAHGISVTMVCPGYVRTNVSLNALTGDGTAHGKMDVAIAGGLSSDECARQIVRAIERRRSEAYIGKERFAIYFSRFAPRLFRRFIRRKKLK